MLLGLVLCPSVLPAGAAGDVAAQKAAAQQRANAAAARLASAQSALAKAEAAFEQATEKYEATRSRLDVLQSQVRELAVRQYVRGGFERPVFDGDLASAARGEAMLRAVTVGTTDSIDEYRAMSQDLEADRAALERSKQAKASALAAQQKEKAAAMAELNRLTAALKALEEQQARDRAAAAARSKQSAAASRSKVGGTTGVIATGSWVCPVQGPRSFTNDWHQPRSGGRLHQGNDIISRMGVPVVASVGGTVRHHNSGLGGLSYFLSGDDGNMYFGTHMSGFAASGRVAAGTVVGYVGMSGNARGTVPHLHFEIHPGGGGAVNPYPTLTKYC